jgi:hypothetical protein
MINGSSAEEALITSLSIVGNFGIVYGTNEAAVVKAKPFFASQCTETHVLIGTNAMFVRAILIAPPDMVAVGIQYKLIL